MLTLSREGYRRACHEPCTCESRKNRRIICLRCFAQPTAENLLKNNIGRRRDKKRFKTACHLASGAGKCQSAANRRREGAPSFYKFFSAQSTRSKRVVCFYAFVPPTARLPLWIKRRGRIGLRGHKTAEVSQKLRQGDKQSYK